MTSTPRSIRLPEDADRVVRAAAGRAGVSVADIVRNGLRSTGAGVGYATLTSRPSGSVAARPSSVRLTEADALEVRRLAAIAGVSESEILRRAALVGAEDVGPRGYSTLTARPGGFLGRGR